MSRYSNTQLVELADSLSPRRWAILRAVSDLRLASGGQLRRRFYPESTASAARLARLDLAWLHEHRVLRRLNRRIGGVRAGSTGFVYAIGPVGQRLLELDKGEGVRIRSRYEPTLGFLHHALAVSEIWVSLHEYLGDPLTGQRGVEFEFRAERAAWRSYTTGDGAPTTLKPDAEVRLRRPDIDEHLWLEIDRATEHRAVIRRKLDAYIRYFQSGREQAREGMFPLTFWLTTTPERAAVLCEVIDALPARRRRLFRVGLLAAAAPTLLSNGRGDP